jgi:aldose 1-epimerase
VGVDSILIPDGTILPNEPNSVNDFWTAPKQIGANFRNPDLLGNCGEGCLGYGTVPSILTPFSLLKDVPPPE